MTQTITNCNETPAGKTYPVADLRTAESIEQFCAYVDAGHPIASAYGDQIRHLRKLANNPVDREKEYCFDYLTGNGWKICFTHEGGLIRTIKLAPLGYKDGRPLHVGDEVLLVSINRVITISAPIISDFGPISFTWFDDRLNANEWRFANQLEAV